MTSVQLSPAELADILRWYAEAGVDLAVDEAPHDRLAEAASDAARRAAAASRPPGHDMQAAPRRAAADLPDSGPSLAAQTPGPAVPPGRPAETAATPPLMSAEQAVLAARRQAAAAATLDDLRERLAAFDGCALKASATQLVFGAGPADARVMLVGDPPGADEDRQGLAFAGAAGRLLDRMLAAIGLERNEVYLATIVPWRPPGNRAPTPQETAVCLPFVRRQIELVAPGLLVCLGGVAAQALLSIADPIGSARGRWFDYSCGPDEAAPRTIRALVMMSPGHLLRQPALKRFAWRDLRSLNQALDA